MSLQTGGTALGEIFTSPGRVAGLGHGLGQGHDTELFTLGGDQAHFLVVNFLVDLMSRVSYDRRTSNSEIGT